MLPKLCHDWAMGTFFEPHRYDLHTHSTISDGTTSPSEIVQEAARIGLAGISLTDHDTTDGWAEAREASAAAQIEFLPGIEITTTHEMRSIHLLAYGPNEAYEPLQDKLDYLRGARKKRAAEMIQRLRKDFHLNWDDLIVQADINRVQSLGRPHLADALVRGGFFRDRSHAFEDALSPSGPYYVPTATLSTVEAITLVRAAGGFPVLAHPAAFRMRRPVAVEAIEDLATVGLGGVEIYHPENRDDWITPIKERAEALGLVVTGSSDFHGEGKPNRLGEYTTPEEVFTDIRGRVATPN